MSDIERVAATDVRDRLVSGDLLLVCAYDSDDKFEANHLEGGISLSEFKTRVPELGKNTELVFYCA